jgi:tetratricopeptide (TPR) repeat protein
MRIEFRLRRAFACAIGTALLGCADLASLDWAGTRSKPEVVVLDETDTQTTRTFLQLATLRENAGDWSGALDKVDKALMHQPHSRAALARRAQLLLLTAEPAAPDLEEPREILALFPPDESDPDLRLARGWLALREGSDDAAIAGAHAAAAAAPDAARAQWMAARLLNETLETQAALERSKRALEIEPGSGAALREHARASLRLTDFESALVDLGTQLRRHGGDVETRAIESELYRRLGDEERARRALESIPAARRSPADHAWLARFALDADQLDAAHGHLDAAVAAHPTNPAVLAAHLALDAREGRADASVARIEAARAARPDDPVLARLAASALAAARRNDEAGPAFARALALDPNDDWTYEELVAWLWKAGSADTAEGRAAALGLAPALERVAVSMLRSDRGDHAGARAAAQEAVQADPNLPIARGTLALALGMPGGDLERAAVLAREARAARPHDPDLAWTLGLTHLRRGQGQTAFEVLREAVGTYPTERPGYAALLWNAGQALERAGERDAALDAARMAINANGDRKPEPSWLAQARQFVEPRAPKPEPKPEQETAAAPAPAAAPAESVPPAPPTADPAAARPAAAAPSAPSTDAAKQTGAPPSAPASP